MSEPRSYVVGLPVVITVHPDGRVTAEVDLSEASDISDALPCDEHGVALYTDAQIDADAAVIEAAKIVVLP